MTESQVIPWKTITVEAAAMSGLASLIRVLAGELKVSAGMRKARGGTVLSLAPGLLHDMS